MIDFIRQINVFDPDVFKKPVHVIGAGATGSWCAFFLAKLGVKDITVWDFDIVEPHNLPNQLYKPSDIGRPKVDALKGIIEDFTGITIKAMNEEVDGSTALTGVVFLLTDTMVSRNNIFKEALRFKPFVDLVIETRMDYNGGRIYTVNPMDVIQVNKYEETLYSDEEADVSGPSACGASQTIVATAVDIVAQAIWNFINYSNQEENYNEILLDTQYKNLITRKFERGDI